MRGSFEDSWVFLHLLDACVQEGALSQTGYTERGSNGVLSIKLLLTFQMTAGDCLNRGWVGLGPEPTCRGRHRSCGYMSAGGPRS